MTELPAEDIRDRLKNRLRRAFFTIMGACVLGYFVAHAIHGERGLVRMSELQSQLQSAQIKLDKLEKIREEKSRKVSLLKGNHIDPDLLEEEARRVLNYAHPDDVVIILDDVESK